MIIENSGMGIAITEETIASDAENNIVSHKFIPQIVTIEDTEKIKGTESDFGQEGDTGHL